MVPELKNITKFSGGVIKKVACFGMQFALCMSLLLVVHADVYAQSRLSESRFMTGSGPFSQTCSIGGGSSVSDCMPNDNGVVHMRFDPTRAAINDNGTAGDTSDDRFEFVVQVRKTGESLPYSVGGLGIEYNTDALGENLNTPAFHDNNTDSATGLGQCTYTRGSNFSNGDYGLVMVDTSPSLLSIFEIADDFVSQTATANSFTTITDEWQDLISFSCQIVNSEGNSSMDSEAGLAFSERLWAENQVWIAGGGNASTANRTVFGVADNDMRGFRLDGRTWVEDYARHDDGMGVRLKFSKGVAAYSNEDPTTPMSLTAANFVALDSDGATTGGDIVVEEHNPGDDYVNIRFASAVSRGILRLVSNSTNGIIRDADDVELADGNFAAALVRDADAPVATNIERTNYSYDSGTETGMSTWEISFSQPLNPASVIAENFCLTAEPGNCAPSSRYATEASIDDVLLSPTGTTVTVVINEGRVKHAPPPLSLEFKRNAVLGADLKIVEDYQTALRDQIQLTDSIPPVITVEAQGDAMPISDNEGIGYRVSYIVRSDEPANLDPNSIAYSFVGVVDDNSLLLLTASVSNRVERTRTGVLTTSTTVTTRIYFPGDRITFEQLQTIKGFTLALAIDDVLSDQIFAGNAPVRTDGRRITDIITALSNGDLTDARIDLSDAAIASRADRTPPILTLAKIGDAIPDINNPRFYSGQFSLTTDDANINGIGDAASYEILRKPIASDELAETTSTLTLISQDANTFQFQYTVELASLDVVRQTEGFTLARGDDPTHLTDGDYNFPSNTDGLIGTGEAIDANVISERTVTDAPTITVQAINPRADANPDPNIETIYPFEAVPDIDPANGNRYTMQFSVQANRAISGIDDESSYQLIVIPVDENELVPATSMTVTLTRADSSDDSTTATLTYAVELNSVEATQRIQGFTLARGTIVDTYGNAPAVEVGEVLDAAATAIARRDTQSPSILVVQTANAINADGYSLRFNITAGEVLQPPSATDFNLLRQLEGGGYAVVSSPVNFSISNVDFSSYNISAEVRLSEAEASNTVGLTLGYSGDGVRDLANNDPITIGPEQLFDDRDGAVAATHQTHPSINVVAQDALVPDENDPLVYRGAFNVSANTTLDTGISGANGIVGLSDVASYWLWNIPSGGGTPTTRTAQITAEVGTANTSATISFTVSFADIDEVMQTMGFTLARRDNLQDFASNTPVDPVNTENEIMRGQRLDSRDEAVAVRDTEPPRYTIAREGSLTIAPSGYTLAFRVTAPADVPSTQFSDLRQSSSYSLLRKLQGSDIYEVLPGRLADEIVADGAVIVRYTNIARLSIDDALNTEGFTLGRSGDDRLRDEANNDPVVSIGGTTQTVTTSPPLPLDASPQALFTIERDSPSLTVAPRGVIVKNGTAYRGSFDVSATEGIDGIESSASYVLLRVPRRLDPADPPGTPIVVLTDEQTRISVGSVNFATLQSVTVSFEVNDPGADANTQVYTLGRKDRLSDLVGNPLVDPADSSVVIGSNGRIDSRVSAEATIPADDTTATIITVVADGDAVADDDNPLRYSGSFAVSATAPVSGISNAGSYNLLRITRGGAHIITTGSTLLQVGEPTDATALGQVATVAFSTTLTAVSLQQTFGFTLGRRANLADGANVSALVDADREDRLDPSDDAVAEVDRPLQITAEAITDTSHTLARFFAPFDQPDGPKAYPKVDDANDLNVNGNRYSMIFEVSSLNGEAIPDIDDINSYVLLHVPTTGTAIDLYRPTNYIVANSVEMISSDQTRARVRYTVEFGADNSDEALALTRRTAGFVLGRAAGRLQSDAPPLDSDGNTIADNTRINPNPVAIAERDTQSPTMEIVEQVGIERITTDRDGTRLTLEAQTVSNEALKPQWLDFENFAIFRKLNDGSYVPFARAGENVTLITFISPNLLVNSNIFRLSQNEAQETVGFTLGYTGTAPLRDLSNNDVIQGGSTQTIVANQPFDIQDSAVAFRDTTQPFIEVTSEGSIVNVLATADLVFTMTASEPVHGISSTFSLDRRPVGSQGPYQLLRILEDNSFVPYDDSTFTRIESISTTQARIIYTSIGLTVAQAQETFGFALGRRIQSDDDLANPNRCPLCDYSGNPPVVFGTTRTVANNEPLDPRPSAQVIAPDKEGPIIRLQALGDAIPDERNPYIYTGQFNVISDAPVLDENAGGRLHDVRSYILLRVPLGEDGNASTPVEIGMIAGTTATLSASLPADEYQNDQNIYNPDRNPFVYLARPDAFFGRDRTEVRIDFGVELAPEIARQTYGFVLGLAPVTDISENNCILCDASSNPPRDRNGDLIAERAPLDTTPTAIVRRDIIPPSFVVAADSLDIQPNGYTMSFGITPPSDVRSTATSEVRRASSYQLLRRLNDSDSYLPVPSASLQPIAVSGNIELRYTMPPLSIEQIRRTESFSVGLAVAGRLRDTSGNDPVVNIDGTTQTVTITPPLPLDASATAQLEVERVNSTITVIANALTKTGNDYSGSFDVSSEESIDGIMEAGSYVLLRFRSGVLQDMLDEASIGITIADLNNLRSATINFNVTDPDAIAGDSFTLGRGARLTDLAGNDPVDPADVNNPISIGERIDSRTNAEAAVPARDAFATITVRADGNAIPSTDNPLVYQGSFTVITSQSLDDSTDEASYRLLHLTTDGATTEIASEITVPSVNLVNPPHEFRVTFATTLTSLTNVNETIGFTLGRRANLRGLEGIPAQIDPVTGRLDASPDAIARVARLLQITSEAVVDSSHYLSDLIPFDQPNGPKAYPKVDDANDSDVNGNRYSMVFEVRSLNGVAVPNIASTSSYVLIHIPTSGNATDLAQYITANSVETITSDTHVRVRYTVEFGGSDDADALALTQRTAGFVLGRAMGGLQNGGMQPLDRDGNAIGNNAPISSTTTAIAARDTQSPTVVVDDANISQGSNGFVLSFDLSTDSGEALNPQWQVQSGSGILRVNTGTANYSPVMRANTNASIVTSISSSLRLSSDAFRLSENEARETDGFTAGYTGASTLRDLSNNDALQGGTTQAITPNQPFDRRDDALAVRDMIAPFIEVSASTATVADVRSDSVTYDMSFDVAAMQQSGEQKVAATDVRGLASATSYQLLRVLTGDRLIAENVENITSANAIGVSASQASLFFSVQVPVSEIDNTVGFTLTRAPSDPADADGCPLCDYASNAPLVANTNEVIVGTLTMPADGFKPLDRSDAAIANIDMRDAVSVPTLTVTASDAMPSLSNGDEYTMNFVVQSTQPISGNLGVLASYRLIHRPTTGSALALRENGLIPDSSLDINDDNNSVTVSYTVRFSDTGNQTQRTAGFALAANDVLMDMLGNRAMNREGDAIGIGEEIDTTATAVARRDTVPPAITIDAGRAVRDDMNSNLYSMRFEVTVADDEQVRGISDANSYTLLQIVETGSPQLINATAMVTTDSGVVIAYDNIEIVENSLNPTIGFTLGRAGSSLRDLANNDPVDANPENSMETIDDDRERLDSRASAIAGFVRGMLLRVKLFLEGPFR